MSAYIQKKIEKLSTSNFRVQMTIFYQIMQLILMSSYISVLYMLKESKITFYEAKKTIFSYKL